MEGSQTSGSPDSGPADEPRCPRAGYGADRESAPRASRHSAESDPTGQAPRNAQEAEILGSDSEEVPSSGPVHGRGEVTLEEIASEGQGDTGKGGGAGGDRGGEENGEVGAGSRSYKSNAASRSPGSWPSQEWRRRVLSMVVEALRFLFMLVLRLERSDLLHSREPGSHRIASLLL